MDNLKNDIIEKLPKDFIETLKCKANNFKDFIISVVPENKKDLLNNQINDFQNNFIKILMFVIFIKKENMNDNIDEFMNKYSIPENNKQKITDYFEYFLQIKELLF